MHKMGYVLFGEVIKVSEKCIWMSIFPIRMHNNSIIYLINGNFIDKGGGGKARICTIPNNKEG